MDDNKYNNESSIALSFEDNKNSDSIAPIFGGSQYKTGKGYINYGSKGKNNYPDELLYYANNGSWHQSCIKYKIRQIAGKGFNVDGDDKATIDFLENICDDYDANELLTMVATDLEIFGGYSVLITWESDWSKIKSIQHIGFNRVRCCEVNADGVIDKYLFKYDWSTDVGIIREFPAYNKNKATTMLDRYNSAKESYNTDEIKAIIAEPTSQLFYYKPYDPSNFYYPLPTYSAIIPSINADINSDVFRLSYMKNGLSPTTGVGYIGNYTPDQWKNEVKIFNKNYLGAKNAGVPIPFKAKTKEELPQFIDIKGSGQDKRFNDFTNEGRQKIFTNHGISSPILLGIETAGKLGNNNELEVSYNKFYSDVILPEQFKILSKFNKFMKINNLATLTIEKLKILDSDVNMEVDDNNKTDDVDTVDDVDNSTQESNNEKE